MLPYILIIILISVILGIVLYLYFLSQSKLKQLQETCNITSVEYKGHAFETNFWDDLHYRLGYSIKSKDILDTIVDSFSNLFNYTIASYVLLEGSRISYKSHLNETVSKKHIDNIKARLLESLKNSNPTVIGTESIEEEITGRVFSGTHTNELLSSFDVAIIINEETLGFLNVSAFEKDQFSSVDISLVNRIIQRSMNEVTALERLLNQEKSKLEVMVGNMVDGVVLVDIDFRVILINSSFLSILGKDPGSEVTIFELVGYFSKVFPLADMLSQVFEKGVTQSVNDLKFDDKYYDILVVPVTTNRATEAVGIIVRNKTKEHELISLREDFTSMIVHELRAPLTVILDTADLIIKRSAQLTGEQTFTLLSQVQKSSGSLLAIVNDLLDTAKLEAGKLAVIKETANINTLLDEQVNYFVHLAKKNNITLTSELDLTLPLVAFDSAKIKQVMANLLSNAIKFTENGSIKVKSHIENKAKEIVISVSDTGVGISKDDKDKLFNKFEQVSRSLSSEEKGTGLGLVITKGIIEAHGGQIRIEDTVPHGTTIVFTLPIS